MPESVVATAPVNATSSSTVPAPPVQEQAPKRTVGNTPIEQKAKPKNDFKSKVEETLWRVNEPTSDETEDAGSMSDIIDKATADAAKPSKDATAPAAEPEVPETTEEPRGKEKLKVRGKEVEVDYDQLKRLAQIGADSQLKNRDISVKEKAVEARAAAAEKAEREAIAVLNALKSDTAMDALIDLHGEEKARALVEGWLRPKIEREMLPEPERQQLEWKERAEKAEGELHKTRQQREQEAVDQQAVQFQEHYQKTIIDALDKGGFPKNADLTPFAREMATWMERGLTKGIEYTPEQLVSLVKEDNNLRVSSLTHVYVSQIEDAKKRGDLAAVEGLGEKLVEVLGEPVMYAIGKYHLAKMQRGRPSVPKQILDTPKVPTKQATKPKPYMSEDEYAAERRRRVEAMERGETVPDWD